MTETSTEKIVTAIIEDEMRQAYLDYSMSVIVGRALPDVRDGLKPVHRRILYAMNDMGMKWNSPYKKSARIVGEVLGKYHPHGDTAVYDSLVRMAQPFSLRYPLVQGHGNWGSQDGDRAAAMRYCVTGDTLILTNKGIIPIETISTKKEQKINLTVLSKDGKKNKAVKFFNSGKHEIIEITTTQGYKLKGSLNHPVLCWTKNSFEIPLPEWKLLGDLKKEDVVILNRNNNLFAEKNPDLKNFHPKNTRNKKIGLPNKITNDLAFLLGALVSEGSFHNKQILFCNKDKDFYTKCLRIANNQFKNITLYERTVKGNCKEFSIYHQQAVKFLINSGLKEVRSDSKEIPEVILRSKKEIVKYFLQSLFEGDGSVISKTDKRHGGKSIELTYNSKSYKLIQQLKIVLLNFGIVTTNPYKDKRNGCYKLIISGVHNIHLFNKEIGFFSKRKKEILNKVQKLNNKRMSQTDYIPFLNDYLRDNYVGREFSKLNLDRYNKLKNNFSKIKSKLSKHDTLLLTWILKNNYFFDKIKEVKQNKTEKVYSVKVNNECHSFVANGFINHNTEARMSKMSQEMLQDIDKETVKFVDNFDSSLKEPTVLPSKFPNLLVNGSTGIAVGMATNIPPHNLKEISSAMIKLIDEPDISDSNIIEIVTGPDFPTGGLIAGRNGILSAYRTGRGRIVVKARINEEERKNRKRLIVTEIPYMINKSDLVKQIADSVKERKIDGISDLRDESDRDGMRIVIELKTNANSELVKNQLFSYTRLQDTFSIILLALVDNKPQILTLKQILQEYLKHRQVVVRKRIEYEKKKAEEKSHILEGLVIALDDIDNAIALIKKSPSASDANSALMKKYSLSQIQSQAILDMKLQKLAKLEHEKIRKELQELKKLIARLKEILADEKKILSIIKDEQKEIISNYGDERKTAILDVEEDMDIEELIPKEEVVVTVSNAGYIKRIPLTTYKTQGRGGVGVIGSNKKEEDVIADIFVANSHSYLLVFTDKGQVHWVKVYRVPEATRYSKGKAIINLIDVKNGDKVSAIIPVKKFDDNFLVISTKNGTVKKTPLAAYSRPRRGGIIGITLDEEDSIVDVRQTKGDQQILLATKKGIACRFREKDVRPIGRTGKGVRGITLKKGDEVVGMIIVDDDTNVLTLTSKGYGKQTKASFYRLINRGGKGVRNVHLTEKNGLVVGIMSMTGNEDLMLITKNGMIIRQSVSGISTVGRNAQGVRVIRLREGDSLVSAAKVLSEEEVEKEVVIQEKEVEKIEPEEEDERLKDPEEDDNNFDKLKEITRLSSNR